jgi:hypothetical protein
VKAPFLCLAHAYIIAMAKVNGDAKYVLCRNGKYFKQPVEDLLNASAVSLRNAGGPKKIVHFQNYLFGYKIIVYDCLSPYRYICNGNCLSNKKLCLLHDADSEHFSVITNLKAVITKKYICNACDTLYSEKHKCDSLLPMYTYTALYERSVKVLSYNFFSEKCFQNHLTLKLKGKLVFPWRQACQNYSFTATGNSKLECIKYFAIIVIRSNLLAIFSAWGW